MRTSVRAIVIKDDQLLVMDRDRFGQKFLSLVGGEVEQNETLEEALHREVLEESTIRIGKPKLVIVEDAGEIYGLQYIYLCDYLGGQPNLASDSIEAKINLGGKNLYKPKWLDLSQLASSNLLPELLKQTLVKFLDSGFPDKPVEITIQADAKV